MVDGTSDNNNEEIRGIVVRFSSSDTNEIEEKTLNIGKCRRSAKDIFEFVRTTLENSKIRFDGMVSQAYDKASVMSASRGVLQALICVFCYIYSLFLSQNPPGGDSCSEEH